MNIITNLSNKTSALSIKVIIWLLLLFLILEKVRLYASFSTIYTDEDQCILWLAADELLHGNFREPCFFGQAYNSCLEAWLAVPFLMAGLDYHQAIPLTTLLMSVIPFLLLIYFYYKKENYFIVFAILFCMLIFPLDYKLISILPRGFITGVFCFGIGYYFLLKESKYSFYLFALFSSFGMAFNEASVLLILPIYLIYLKTNFNNIKFYLQIFIGSLPAILYKAYSYYFYNISNPEYNYFIKPKIEWKSDFFLGSFIHLDDWFFSNFSVVLILAIVLIIALIYKKENFKLFVFLITIVAILATLGLTRTQEGIASVYFNKSRLFVFIPLLFSVLFSVSIPYFKVDEKRQLLIVRFLCVILIGVCVTQQILLNDKIKTEVENPNKVVSFLSITDVYKHSYHVIYIGLATNNNTVLYDCTRKEDYILHLTIPLLSKNKIKTCLSYYDRRFWVLTDVLQSTPKKILVSGNFEDRYNRETLKPYKRRIITKDNEWLVEYNLKKNIENTCLEDFDLPIRIH